MTTVGLLVLFRMAPPSEPELLRNTQLRIIGLALKRRFGSGNLLPNAAASLLSHRHHAFMVVNFDSRNRLNCPQYGDYSAAMLTSAATFLLVPR